MSVEKPLSDIIKFPNSTDCLVKGTSDPLHRLVTNTMQFTCTDCFHQCTADFNGLIFKNMKFYCSSCGSLYEITNTAFIGTTK